MPRQDPQLRTHSSGQFIVTIKRRTHYLGYDRRSAQAERLRLLAIRNELPAAPAKADDGEFTVAILLARFFAWAPSWYRRPDGTATSELANLKRALVPLARLLGDQLVSDIDGAAIEAVRDSMINHSWATAAERVKLSEGWCRKYINRNLERIKRVFHWGKRKKLVSADVWAEVKDVQGLREGRSTARESVEVQPASEDSLEATIPLLPPGPRAMARLQLLTGMRPGEVCRLRPGDIDTTGAALVRILRGTRPNVARCWTYLPGSIENPARTQHKTAHRSDGQTRHQRIVIIGPQAQAILKPWLDGLKPSDWIFTPRRSMDERFRERRQARRSGVQPSQEKRRKARPMRSPSRSHYLSEAYAHAVAATVRRVNRARAAERPKLPAVEHWHPHQLRHNAATRLEAQFGYEVARVVLGHRTLDATKIYARGNLEAAFKAMGEAG